MVTTYADHSLFINCGGRSVSFEGSEYEENLNEAGPSYFEGHDRWAYSSTGTYMSNDRAKYIARDDSSTEAEIYQTARLSPSSLKFYGTCLRKGSYRVRLHFAEIMFSDTSNFSSLGRRIFDVAIQVSGSMNSHLSSNFAQILHIYKILVATQTMTILTPKLLIFPFSFF